MLRLFKVLCLTLIMAFILQACSLSLPFDLEGKVPITGADEVVELPEEPVQQEEAPVIEEAQPEEPAVEAEAEEPEPVEEEEPEEPPPPPPAPQLMPGEAILIDAQTVKDCYSGGSLVAGEPIVVGTGCDVWRLNFIERPFDPSRVDYNPNLDIVRQELGYDDDFYYARLMVDMKEGMQPDLGFSYGVELDLDVDGDGDVLIYVNGPEFMEDEWSRERVLVWQDLNDDVGGATPVEKDEAPTESDGYEFIYFESGYGDDPDAAWARISPTYPSAVEFAFKKYLVEKEDSFMWWMWASMEPYDPHMFDYVDRFEKEEKYFIDNSCRWIMHAPPNANLPNSCPVFKAAPTPGVGPCVCTWSRQQGLVCDCP